MRPTTTQVWYMIDMRLKCAHKWTRWTANNNPVSQLGLKSLTNFPLAAKRNSKEPDSLTVNYSTKFRGRPSRKESSLKAKGQSRSPHVAPNLPFPPNYQATFLRINKILAAECTIVCTVAKNGVHRVKIQIKHAARTWNQTCTPLWTSTTLKCSFQAWSNRRGPAWTCPYNLSKIPHFPKTCTGKIIKDTKVVPPCSPNLTSEARIWTTNRALVLQLTHWAVWATREEWVERENVASGVVQALCLEIQVSPTTIQVCQPTNMLSRRFSASRSSKDSRRNSKKPCNLKISLIKTLTSPNNPTSTQHLQQRSKSMCRMRSLRSSRAVAIR